MFNDEIPLGHRLLPLQARPDALGVGFLRDTPFLVEPGRRRFRPFSVVPQFPYKLFLDTRVPPFQAGGLADYTTEPIYSQTWRNNVPFQKSVAGI